MKRFLPLLYLALFAAGAWAVWHFFFPPPEKVIRQRLEKLAAALSESPGGNIARVANASRIGSFFHPEIQIHVDGFGRGAVEVRGRGELEQAALAARQNFSGILIELYNISAALGDSPTNAAAQATALVRFNGNVDPAVQDLRFGFEKSGRQWLIRSVAPAPAKTLKVE